MKNENLDKYLEKVNEVKGSKGIVDFVPLYPMLRVEDNKLYICVLMAKQDDEVWTLNASVKPEHMVLIDAETEEVVDVRNTETINFNEPDSREITQKEMAKYTVEKTLQYKNYLMEDIKNEQLPIQKKLSNLLGDSVEIDGETVNINEYLYANFEEIIEEKIKELVNILTQSKYSSLTIYYDNLVNQILTTYKEEKKIDLDKIKTCIEIMNVYYVGVLGIEDFFNI